MHGDPVPNHQVYKFSNISILGSMAKFNSYTRVLFMVLLWGECVKMSWSLPDLAHNHV